MNTNNKREAKAKRRMNRKSKTNGTRVTPPKSMPPIMASQRMADQMKQLLVNLSIWLSAVEGVELMPGSQLVSHFTAVPHWLTNLQQFGNSMKPDATDAIQRVQNLIDRVQEASRRINAELDLRLAADPERSKAAVERIEQMNAEVEAAEEAKKVVEEETPE